jgi:hypothetical protein
MSREKNAMNKIMLSLFMLLSMWNAWADEILELQPRLAEAAGAQNLAYVELRDRLVSEISTNVLFQAVDDERLDWRERLVARICYERIARGKDIEALRVHDWRQHPGFDLDWLKNLSGPGRLMQPLAISYLAEVGLWYYYVEMTWKQTGELTVSPLRHINDHWQRWCRMALAGRPEEVYLHLAMTERIEKDELLEAADAARLYRELLDAKWPEAVPVWFGDMRHTTSGKSEGLNILKARHAQLYRGMFQPILDMADHRHAEMLEAYMARQPRLAELLPSLADVRGRAPVAPKAEPSFSLGMADEK